MEQPTDVGYIFDFPFMTVSLKDSRRSKSIVLQNLHDCQHHRCMTKRTGNIRVELYAFRRPLLRGYTGTYGTGHFKSLPHSVSGLTVFIVVDANTMSCQGLYPFPKEGFMRQAALMTRFVDIAKLFLCPLS